MHIADFHQYEGGIDSVPGERLSDALFEIELEMDKTIDKLKAFMEKGRQGEIMGNLINDVRTAADVFTVIRNGRKEGKELLPQMVRKYPVIGQNPSFLDTVEGGVFFNKDKALRDAVWAVFRTLLHEDKRKLSFLPKDGRFLERVQFWKSELGAVLPNRQYHKAMGVILHEYGMVKRSRMA